MLICIAHSVTPKLDISVEEGSFKKSIGYENECVTSMGMLTANLNIYGTKAKMKIHVVSTKYQGISLIVGHHH